MLRISNFCCKNEASKHTLENIILQYYQEINLSAGQRYPQSAPAQRAEDEIKFDAIRSQKIALHLLNDEVSHVKFPLRPTYIWKDQLLLLLNLNLTFSND